MIKTGTVYKLILPLSFLLLFASTLRAQQPFVTDDADVTPKGKFHFEFSNEFDLLQKSAFPNLKQNTADFEVDYGLFEHGELGVAAPLLTTTLHKALSKLVANAKKDLKITQSHSIEEAEAA